MGKGAASWTVVSSDQAVQRAARQSGAKILSSDQFADLLASSLSQPGSLEKDRSQHSESQEDVEDWLKLFGE
jgi:predicted RNA-binding protein with PIN domain